ncbi:mechanosensitive ion channel family protein [Chitinibacter tainanensis]|uniref:mechanosensitive ion channel family protein n=1 Tax=Chitinibacter tainanensis TaxID=230667 RepID=UPI0006851C35|nr:mechanosensitive ion channel domain-containing protein [Chitinibacter tainanensis]
MLVLRRLLLICLCCLSLFSYAEPTPVPASEPHAVTINNRTLVQFRVGLLNYSVEDRAQAAELRIRRILEHSNAQQITLTPVQTPDAGISVALGKEQVFLILQQDIDTLAGETLDSVAAQAQQQLEQLLREQRELRDPEQLLRAAVYTVVATLLFAGTLWLLSRARVILLKNGRRYITRPLARLARQTTGVQISLLNRILRWLINLTTSLIGLSLTYTWLTFVFSQFPFTRVWSEQLNQAILQFLGKVASGVLSALPGLLVVIFIIVCARYTARFLRFVFGRIERGELNLSWFDRETASTTRKIMTFLVWLLAIAMCYPYLPGADTEAFKGLSVMVGLMVSLGASSVVGQFASGLILIYAKSLKQGEYVQIGDTEGTVIHIGLFATKIHTNLREEVSIPNSVLVGQSVKNFSRLAAGGGVITQVGVTIGYDTPWRQVEAMLIEAAQQTKGVRNNPRPVVYQTALSDYYVEYFLRIAVDEPRRRLEIMSDLHAKIQDVFNTYGVQIMSPHYIADPEQEIVIAPANWYPAPAQVPTGAKATPPSAPPDNGQ